MIGAGRVHIYCLIHDWLFGKQVLQYLYLGPKWKAVFQVVQLQLTNVQRIEIEDSGEEAPLPPCPLDSILNDFLSNCASSFIMVNTRQGTQSCWGPASHLEEVLRMGPHPTPSQHCAELHLCWAQLPFLECWDSGPSGGVPFVISPSVFRAAGHRTSSMLLCMWQKGTWLQHYQHRERASPPCSELLI